ncbi:MAG: nicotinate-nucleotide diphosphorylase (carboxylating), partial [Bacteroidales bacterium]|nr:nicotinate-nucleotide diphosphorylase (carboxylating) [Bacteroidales bacterium]
MNREQLIDQIITLAFEEDVAAGDITTNALIPENSRAVATLTMKANGIVSGLEIAGKVFSRLDKD